MSDSIPFKPYSYYSKGSKSLTHYFKGDPDYSEVLDEATTVYRSLETGEVVGIKINVDIAFMDDSYSLVKTDDSQSK